MRSISGSSPTHTRESLRSQAAASVCANELMEGAFAELAPRTSGDAAMVAHTAFLQMHEQQGDGCGRDAGDARRLADGRRPDLRQALPHLDRQTGNTPVIEIL